MPSITTPLTPTRFLMSLIRPYAGRLTVGVVAMLVTTACMLVIPQLLKGMFDIAIKNADKTELLKLASAMLGLVVIMMGGVMVRSWFIQVVSNNLTTALRLRMAQHLLALDIGYFERASVGDVLTRMIGDTTVIREFFINGFPVALRGCILSFGTLGLLFYTNTFLTFILLGAAAPMALIGWRMGRWIKNYSRQQQDNMSKFSGLNEEMVSQIRTVKAFGQHMFMYDRLYALAQIIFHFGNTKSLVSGGLIASNLFIGFLALIGVIVLGGNQVIDGTLSLGSMMAFLFYLAFLGDGVSSLSEFWANFQSTRASADRILEFMNISPRITPPTRPTPLPKLGRQNARAVAFKNVTFAYESRPEVKVADGISFMAKAGQKVAIVGPSGAGKSTLFSLILRFYDVTHGSVSLDGIDVRKLSFDALRGAVAVVAQDPAIFSTTVRENVAYGRPDADDEDVWAALRVAHADGFVNDLPHGLDTLVGEKGVQLSGGQRQRLAIARAVLVDAPILLLDEATSHLDAESERAVQEALEAAGKGRTVITIAHRLSTVKAADRIYVMDKGRLVAHGTHAELMTSSPLYKALATLQMA